MKCSYLYLRFLQIKFKPYLQTLSPGTPGWGLGMGLTTPPCKTPCCYGNYDKHNYHSRLEPTIWQYDHQINQCQKQLDITMSVTNKEFVLQLRNHFSALADWGDQDGDTQRQ